MDDSIVLAMHGICMTFPGVKALEDVDFTLRKGEIHALMGENGAGKSTLIKVLTGVYEKDSGEIRLAGVDHLVENKSPEDAQRLCISTVYQEVNLCPNLSIAENVYIGREPRKHGFIDWKMMNAKASELMRKFSIDADVTVPVGHYSIALQQMVAIARAVDMQCKVLIFDEPTSSLDEEEVAKLFDVMRALKARGVGIIFVTHFLEQVYEVCDRITVLRNGKLVGEYTVHDLPRYQLVAKMMGKDFDDLASIKSIRTKKPSDAVVVRTDHLGHSRTIKPFSLEVKRGEVMGLAGLLGSGRSELARCIYGADKPDHGRMEMNGKPFFASHPIDSMKAGMAYLPEDRKKEGVIGDLSVKENIIIALQARKGTMHLLSKKDQEKFADTYIDLLQIKTRDRDMPVRSLSGGNQQKVIIGRWLLTQPDFIILDEPTRGIDVGTKTEIQKLVLQLADRGTAVMFISSEIDEMLRTCDHMAVMRDGSKIAELDESQLNQKTIMATIAGGGK
ncbi:MAG: sugar ABC transporter ATP-binding protein [Sphaerochaetaceae bacterium]|jgi:simple sugar transport system ATP-binding protein